MSLALLVQKLFAKKNILPKKRCFDHFWPLHPNPLKLVQFWRYTNEKKRLKGLSIAFLRGSLPIIGSEIMAHIPRNNMTLCKIWPLVTSGDLHIDLRERMTEILSNVGNHWAHSNTFSRAFLSLLVFELGGVVILHPPPPPPGRRWLRPPPGRGLTKIPLAKIRFFTRKHTCSLI